MNGGMDTEEQIQIRAYREFSLTAGVMNALRLLGMALLDLRAEIFFAEPLTIAKLLASIFTGRRVPGPPAR